MMADDEPRPGCEGIAGCLFAVTDTIAVCRIDHLPSFAIPLSIREPDSVHLIGWAIAASRAVQRETLAYLLMLRHAYSEGMLRSRGLVLATHVRDVRVEIVEDGASTLSAGERDVLARAVLADTPDRLSELLPFVAPALDALIERDEEAPVGLRKAGRTLVVSEGFVPETLLVRSGDGYACFRVEDVTLRFAETRSVEIAFGTDWSPSLLRDHAILVGNGVHRIGRLRTGTEV